MNEHLENTALVRRDCLRAMEGDANGAPHPEPATYRAKFTGPYEHRLVTGGIGHDLPQEAPAAFATALLDAARMA